MLRRGDLMTDAIRSPVSILPLRLSPKLPSVPFDDGVAYVRCCQHIGSTLLEAVNVHDQVEAI